MSTVPLLIDGESVVGLTTLPVLDKFTGRHLADVVCSGRDDVARAVGAAAKAFATHRLSPYDRYSVLRRGAELLEQRKPRFVDTIVSESGFTVSDAETEIARATQTLLISAEEAKRIHGEMVPLDGAPGVANRLGFTIRVPVGVVCAITPFNSPLNTVVHKVAPAVAAGDTVVLKPASSTPLTALLFCELLLDTGLPPGYINLVVGAGRDVGSWLLEDERIRFYSFTGSSTVGHAIQRGAGLRRTQLELGSVSSTIVCDDANIDWAVPRCVNASSARQVRCAPQYNASSSSQVFTTSSLTSSPRGRRRRASVIRGIPKPWSAP